MATLHWVRLLVVIFPDHIHLYRVTGITDGKKMGIDYNKKPFLRQNLFPGLQPDKGKSSLLRPDFLLVDLRTLLL